MTYPNVLVADYVKKAGSASPQVLAKAEQYIHLGYQRLLTFEVSGGGFDWCGHGPAVIWLTAYGAQEFSDMAKVYPVDPHVIQRTQNWLMSQQAGDGTWSDNHGARWLPAMGDQKLLLTSYVAWSLLESGGRDPRLDKSITYILDHLGDARDNAYVLALAANALAAWDPKDPRTLDALRRLEALKKEAADGQSCSFPTQGQSLCYSTGDSAAVETTALAALAMLKAGQYPQSVNQSLVHLVKSKYPGGTWGSTQATILSLKALVAGLGGIKQEGEVDFTVAVDGKEVGAGKITGFNSEVVQRFHADVDKGKHEVEIKLSGKTNMMYQITARHHEPWRQQAPPAQPVLDIAVEYDRTELSTAEEVKAKAILRYHGRAPTYMVIVDLGIPPGFAVDPADFDKLVKNERNPNGIEKYTLTARQATLYLGDVRPGAVMVFDYSLKPKFPLRAQVPATVAYEYYTPAHRATAQPVEFIVKGR